MLAEVFTGRDRGDGGNKQYLVWPETSENNCFLEHAEFVIPRSRQALYMWVYTVIVTLPTIHMFLEMITDVLKTAK